MTTDKSRSAFTIHAFGVPPSEPTPPSALNQDRGCQRREQTSDEINTHPGSLLSDSPSHPHIPSPLLACPASHLCYGDRVRHAAAVG